MSFNSSTWSFVFHHHEYIIRVDLYAENNWEPFNAVYSVQQNASGKYKIFRDTQETCEEPSRYSFADYENQFDLIAQEYTKKIIRMVCKNKHKDIIRAEESLIKID